MIFKELFFLFFTASKEKMPASIKKKEAGLFKRTTHKC